MTVVDFRAGASGGHVLHAIHEKVAAAGAADFPDGHTSIDAQSSSVVGEHNPPAPAKFAASPKAEPPVLACIPWADSNAPLLALLADVLDDLERTRIANENRLRQLTRDEVDSDGEERGFGLTLDQPQVAALADVVDALGKLEHQSILNLQRVLRKHPLGPWVKRHKGVGEKQAARLLAAIGDPYWNTLHGRPRLISELWQYAGHGDPARSKKRKGSVVEYSPAAKMRLYNISAKCVTFIDKATCPVDEVTRCAVHRDDCACSPYRKVYDARKAKTVGRAHTTACVRCGPSGHPAEPGSPWSDGHRNADAIRIVGKEILRDLWCESERIHEAAQQ